MRMKSPLFWPRCCISKMKMVVSQRVVNRRSQVLFTITQMRKHPNAGQLMNTHTTDGIVI